MESDLKEINMKELSSNYSKMYEDIISSKDEVKTIDTVSDACEYAKSLGFSDLPNVSKEYSEYLKTREENNIPVIDDDVQIDGDTALLFDGEFRITYDEYLQKCKENCIDVKFDTKEKFDKFVKEMTERMFPFL